VGTLLSMVVATPVREESMMSVDVTERVACDGSHFIVSVQRYTYNRPAPPLTDLEQTM
jgi:hypothetical protein